MKKKTQAAPSEPLVSVVYAESPRQKASAIRDEALRVAFETVAVRSSETQAIASQAISNAEAAHRLAQLLS